MNVWEIAARLAELDRARPVLCVEGEVPKYRGGGGSYAWDFLGDDGNWYVVKSQNNNQEESSRQQAPGFPLKILPTELVVGRLGQLLSPPICPIVCVVNVPSVVASGCISPHNNLPIASGPSFGSRLVEHVADTKAGGSISLISPQNAARLVTFHTWLSGTDPAALISSDGSVVLSVDHGYFLTGSCWDDTKLNEVQPDEPILLSEQWRQSGYLADATLFRDILEELWTLPDDAIIHQFAGMPPEWGTSYEFMARIALFVLERRRRVQRAVAKLWGGP